MKQFNTFTMNSPVNSDYYSPKSASPKFLFPSGAESRGINYENQRSNLFIKETFEKLPSVSMRKEQGQALQEESEENNNSKVSLLLSQVSVPPAKRSDFDAQRLYNLENKISQSVLELREQKITLMQELSRAIDVKNLYEHYLNKKSKEKDDRETNYGSRVEPNHHSSKDKDEEIVPLHVSAQILRKNEDLHLRLKQLQIKEEIFGPSLKIDSGDDMESKKLMDEIMKVRQLNANLQNQISQKIKGNATEGHDSRFVTFLPQDREKHLQGKSNLNQYQQLKEKYTKLSALARENGIRLTKQEEAYVEVLRQQNNDLLLQVEELMKRKQGSNLNQLRQKIQQNQHEKLVFLGELQKFKNMMRALKQENEHLKKELSR